MVLSKKVEIIYPSEPKFLVYTVKYKQINHYKRFDCCRMLLAFFNKVVGKKVEIKVDEDMIKVIPESDVIITGTPEAYIWSFTLQKYEKLAFFPQG